MTYLFCFLPNGNYPEFASLEAEMKRRGVALEVTESTTLARAYRLPLTDEHKLPTDAEGHYFGDDRSGYELREWDERFVKLYSLGSWRSACTHKD